MCKSYPTELNESFYSLIAIKVGKECQNGEMRLNDGNMGRKANVL